MRPFRSLACGIAALSSVFLTAQTVTGPLVDPRGVLVGGGENYPWTVYPPSGRAGYYVSTKDQLVYALGQATWGQTVYVNDAAEIDLTGSTYLRIAAGVTLVSGRGRSGSRGALLYNREIANYPQLLVTGTAVRITGLRLRGPDTNSAPPSGCGGNDPTGIGVIADTLSIWQVNIDNNELWGWPNSAVEVELVYGAQVHHNHIHHNRRQVSSRSCRNYNLGYGVACSDVCDVVIEANLFDHNCHSIASDGRLGARYEARYNVCLNGNVGHAFDVHGGADRGDGTNLAGDWFNVHHNTFLQTDKAAFKIRGLPRIAAYVYSNNFRHSSFWDTAFSQVNATGNLAAWSNSYSYEPGPGWFVSLSADSFWRLRRFSWVPMNATTFADFDGDGRSDAFLSYGGNWLLSRAALGDWQVINGSSIAPSDLRFGDFDGDGRTDVFKTNGAQWHFSRGGTGAWEYLNSSSASLGSLAFGDFNGDRRTDVFYANGSRWYVSLSGTGAWTLLTTSNLTVNSLRLGDFNADGRTDVFYADGVSWWVSFGGSGAWTYMNSSNVPLSELAFADFDGDRRTDVFYGNGSRWYTSSAAVGPWFPRQSSDQRVGNLGIGDFNGDRKADVLSTQSP